MSDADIDRLILSRVQGGKFTLVELSKLASYNLPGMTANADLLKKAVETIARSSDVCLAELRSELLENRMTAAEFDAFRQTLKLVATNITSEELVRKIVHLINPQQHV